MTKFYTAKPKRYPVTRRDLVLGPFDTFAQAANKVEMFEDVVVRVRDDNSWEWQNCLGEWRALYA